MAGLGSRTADLQGPFPAGLQPDPRLPDAVSVVLAVRGRRLTFGRGSPYGPTLRRLALARAVVDGRFGVSRRRPDAVVSKRVGGCTHIDSAVRHLGLPRVHARRLSVAD